MCLGSGFELNALKGGLFARETASKTDVTVLSLAPLSSTHRRYSALLARRTGLAGTAIAAGEHHRMRLHQCEGFAHAPTHVLLLLAH